ncbi:histone chaperone ASF1-like [Exaiptasia diaphana]|uniref:Uncharacterized protein n=1 Tax=Exaiptasia diaphana TaxID=2652724 RepID=A0A913YR75_EXADI|nr:histone chaperone ASF1-like [Exaiptasia diaphana]
MAPLLEAVCPDVPDDKFDESSEEEDDDIEDMDDMDDDEAEALYANFKECMNSQEDDVSGESHSEESANEATDCKESD